MVGRTESIVIFGAGEAGRRALAHLRRSAGREVLAFADNNADRHGALVEGLRVITPESLPACDVDRIVVASQAHKDIVVQLRRLGFATSRIEIYNPGADRCEPLAPPAAGLPRILILTDDCIAPSHGTGAVLLRHFAGYPRELLMHGYLRLKGDPFLPHSYKVASLSECAAAGPVSGTERPPMNALQLIAETRAALGGVDLVYSNFFGEAGLTFLRELVDVLDPSIPVVHHVHDLLTEEDDRFDGLLRDVSPRVAEFWAIGPGLGERVTRVTGRRVVPMNTFSCPITPTFKQSHRELDRTFTAVMLGNSHMPWVLDKLRDVWAEVRRRHGVGPIRWYAYPTSVLYVERAGVRVEPDIEYYGYLNDRVLHEHLCDADLAIIPFNITDEPEYAYARYSIPSRLTEFMNAGLPVIAAAGAQTEARRFMVEHGVGDCATIANTADFTTELLRVMQSTERRRALGAAGRAFAVTNGNVEHYRQRLFARLANLTGMTIPQSEAVAA